jgi:type IV pilus assembly protein PilB
LRALLRQDPDTILVGEIRDYETAEVAVQAALTGHLVLSTLHTNDAPVRLLVSMNMGLEPFLVVASVNTIVAQRLMRTVCPNCKVETKVIKEEFQKFGVSDTEIAKGKCFKGQGCANATRADTKDGSRFTKSWSSLKPSKRWFCAAKVSLT